MAYNARIAKLAAPFASRLDPPKRHSKRVRATVRFGRLSQDEFRDRRCNGSSYPGESAPSSRPSSHRPSTAFDPLLASATTGNILRV